MRNRREMPGIFSRNAASRMSINKTKLSFNIYSVISFSFSRHDKTRQGHRSGTFAAPQVDREVEIPIIIIILLNSISNQTQTCGSGGGGDGVPKGSGLVTLSCVKQQNMRRVWILFSSVHLIPKAPCSITSLCTFLLLLLLRLHGVRFITQMCIIYGYMNERPASSSSASSSPSRAQPTVSIRRTLSHDLLSAPEATHTAFFASDPSTRSSSSRRARRRRNPRGGCWLMTLRWKWSWRMHRQRQRTKERDGEYAADAAGGCVKSDHFNDEASLVISFSECSTDYCDRSIGFLAIIKAGLKCLGTDPSLGSVVVAGKREQGHGKRLWEESRVTGRRRRKKGSFPGNRVGEFINHRDERNKTRTKM